MSFFSCLSPVGLVIITSIITLVIADDLDTDDLNIIGNLIVTIGSFLLTIAALEQSQNSRKEKSDSIQDINEQIQQLYNKLEKLK